MISSENFVQRAVQDGVRRTINDHLTFQGITEPNARRSKRTMLHKELQSGGRYHEHLDSIFVPSKGGRGREPLIADLCDPEDDKMTWTPTLSRHLALIEKLPIDVYAYPATADRVVAAQEVMMNLPYAKQQVLADAYTAQHHEMELRKVKEESQQKRADQAEGMVGRLEATMDRMGRLMEVIADRSVSTGNSRAVKPA